MFNPCPGRGSFPCAREKQALAALKVKFQGSWIDGSLSGPLQAARKQGLFTSGTSRCLCPYTAPSLPCFPEPPAPAIIANVIWPRRRVLKTKPPKASCRDGRIRCFPSSWAPSQPGRGSHTPPYTPFTLSCGGAEKPAVAEQGGACCLRWSPSFQWFLSRDPVNRRTLGSECLRGLWVREGKT